jgi:hypothetical protein
MDASSLIYLVLSLLGMTTLNEPEDPGRSTRPLGG